MFPTHVGIALGYSHSIVRYQHVPYACGDCATPPTDRARKRPCSLRMWGLRGGLGLPSRAWGMFPTHVGIAPAATPLPVLPGNVPYACGDCAYIGSVYVPIRKCSLRMWGLRDDAPGVIPYQVMFPTHVGIARFCGLLCGTVLNVPYACGDCAAPLFASGGARRCSLRMWGLRDHSTKSASAYPMFPTHVGIARPRPGAARCCRHVPYACGDCAGKVWTPPRQTSCSLRMWGLRGVLQRESGFRQMFPTHVGIARRHPGASESGADVPYACGDCADVPCQHRAAELCSLRMWGLRGRRLAIRSLNPMFPTHVGIARVRRLGETGSGDVPYACGDCAAPSWNRGSTGECSLRMWGLRVFDD